MGTETVAEYSPEVLSFFENNEIFDEDAIDILVLAAMSQFSLASKEEFNDKVLEELNENDESEILSFMYELIR
jgi:hypothetical protein